jgi:hypothetical protein
MDTIATRVAAPDRMGQATAVEQARAVAEVQARVVVARQCPRDIAAATRAMRETCGQMALAERAFYAFPRGKDKKGKPNIISGPSVHLARELARVWGNVEYSINEMRRDDRAGQSEMLAYAWDLETNTRNSAVFIVPHFRDKSDGRPQQLTDMRDIYENNANNGSRRVREAIFNVLPVWFAEEAKAICTKTLADGGGRPLAQRVADAIDAFENIGVKVQLLEARIGSSATEWTPQDVAQLGILITSIRRNEISKDEAFSPAERGVSAADIPGAPAPQAPAAGGNGAPAASAAQQPAAPAEPAATEQGTLDDPPAAERELSTAPGSSTSDQQKTLWNAIFVEKFGFQRDDRAEARAACETLAGRKMARSTMDNLSEAEAAKIIATLATVPNRAELAALLAEKAGPA